MPEFRKSVLSRYVEKRWYSHPGVLWLLLPLEWLFRALVVIRRVILTSRQKKTDLPVVVVGNIAVGGTGKTPVIIALAEHLKKNGLKPGIISRGYGRTTKGPQLVSKKSSSDDVGDEPLEIFHSAGVAVCVAEKRTEAINLLVKHTDCDIVLADDGLQHYALARDVEIVVLDELAAVGNGHCFPLGPLREPPSRLNSVDFIVQKSTTHKNYFAFEILPSHFENVLSGETQALDFFSGATKLCAIAGIGKPQKFFNTVAELVGHKNFVSMGFKDHHRFKVSDLDVVDHMSVLMTAKDAVKCGGFARENWWLLRIRAELSPAFLRQFDQKIATFGATK